MLHRKGVAMVAACAALACTGMVRAGSVDSVSEQGVVLHPNYLQVTTAPAADATTAPASAPAAPPKPLMGLLEKAGVGTPMENAGFSVGGYIEGGYTVSANGDNSHTLMAGRVFDTKNNRPVLDQVDFFIDRPVDYGKAATNHTIDIGGHIEVLYGWDSGLIHSSGLLDNSGTRGVITGNYRTRTSPENQFDIEAAYVDFALPVGSGLRVRLGKFATLLGYETINPTTNAFYSHSYMFGYAIPFTQTGIMTEYKLSDDFLLDAGITRGWDQTSKDNNGDPDLLAEVTWTPQESDFLKKWKAILNLSEGPQGNKDNHDWWTVLDLVVNYAASDKLALGLNADLGDAPHVPGFAGSAVWFGLAGYGAYTLNDYMTANLRAEYYTDSKGFTIGATHASQDLYEVTANVAFKPFPSDAIGQNLQIRPEIRYDYSQRAFFKGGTDHGQFTFGIDAFFVF